MDKLLLTVTLVAFSSGVLCNVAQNLTEGGATGVETQLNSTVYKLVKMCTIGEVRDDYVVVQGMGAYKLHKRLIPWNQARKICMEEGGQLAVINSKAEGTMLVNWLIRDPVWEVWIGTHDLFEPRQWVTLTGETLTAAGYDNWLPGEPNYGSGETLCGTLKNLGESGGMSVYTCNSELYFFCKINLC